MTSGKTVKLVAYELLQFAALVVPLLVVMERFARVVRRVRGGDHTAYWLVVAASVAYVTSVTLLVWLPVKYLTLRRRRFLSENSQWRPIVLAYIVLCTLPCFAIIIASSKVMPRRVIALVQVDGDPRFDDVRELPVSLVLFCLVCVDIIQRIRTCRLLGQSDSLEPDFGPVLTHLQRVNTVTDQLSADGGQNGLTTEGGNNHSTVSSRAPSMTYLYSPSTHLRAPSGPLGLLWRRDGRAEVFVDSFLFWLDTVEMLRAAGEPAVFRSAWVFPVYILVFLSTLRAAITPNNPLLSFAGFALQDLPFFVLRVALIAVFSFVTPVFYPLKNVLVCLAFIYFTFLTKLRIFRSQSLF